MNIPKPVIFDNFYTNPYRVRDVALSLDYWGCRDHPTGGNWPGERSLYVNQVAPELFNSFVKNIYRIWGWPDSKSVLFDMNFQICKAADGDSWVHQDVMPQNYTHVALVYLNPNPYANFIERIDLLKSILKSYILTCSFRVFKISSSNFCMCRDSFTS